MNQKRVFTKNMNALVSTLGGIEVKTGADVWIPQEDIEIIGSQVDSELLCNFAVNGIIHAIVDLSLAPGMSQDGDINFLHTVALQWNVVGQGGGGVGSLGDNAVVMFPAGYSIPVKEDGHVNLHLLIETPAGETGDLYANVRIYYLRVGK